MRFQQLQPKDFPLLQQWLQRAHIKQWWDDGDDTLEKVKSHYTSNPDTTKRFLLLDSTQKPIGYFQYYLSEESIGIDQFLAEESSLGQGLGTAAIKEFISMICEKHDPKIIVTDPAPDNKRAIRCYEKVGFRHTEIVRDYRGKLAYLMKLHAGVFANKEKATT